MVSLSRQAVPRRRAVGGVSMIEVLVTLVIIAFGLLGLAGLQARLQTSEMESYQRTQALLLLNDMANRIATNRNNAADYVTTVASPLGAGMTCPTTTATVGQRDLREWCNALQGAGETTDLGATKVGAMVGGRGCVESVDGDYLVTVVWQGLTPIAAPPASVACGADSYNGTTGSCVNDRCRRTVTTLVRIATLL
ncbi:MAG: type IV pilus modification protein PilV [Burkholderiales bacterium RIFCSPHIGHO2_12_FULL_61_11]|nr:MAG: type IV pilus modification protein PilV [Burkholderiales bacterium RIFCSPHIGHO2_12_FULL_61_11]